MKIQKWDEQSYYSLKSSAEKSHAVLHKLVCEFDETLKSPVAGLLDAELENVAKGATPSVVADATHAPIAIKHSEGAWWMGVVYTETGGGNCNGCEPHESCVPNRVVSGTRADVQAPASQRTRSCSRYAARVCGLFFAGSATCVPNGIVTCVRVPCLWQFPPAVGDDDVKSALVHRLPQLRDRMSKLAFKTILSANACDRRADVANGVDGFVTDVIDRVNELKVLHCDLLGSCS